MRCAREGCFIAHRGPLSAARGFGQLAALAAPRRRGEIDAGDFYATTGVGGYREELDATGHEETNIAFNTGGGAKITLIGPLRVRVDYRVFKLRGEPLRPSAVHRLYAGVNLAF